MYYKDLKTWKFNLIELFIYFRGDYSEKIYIYFLLFIV